MGALDNYITVRCSRCDRITERVMPDMLGQFEVDPCDCPAWLPIETAPKDGTDVLTWSPWGGHVVASYDTTATGGVWCTNNPGDVFPVLDGDSTPTHWQPLPAPPGRV